MCLCTSGCMCMHVIEVADHVIEVICQPNTHTQVELAPSVSMDVHGLGLCSRCSPSPEQQVHHHVDGFRTEQRQVQQAVPALLEAAPTAGTFRRAPRTVHAVHALPSRAPCARAARALGKCCCLRLCHPPLSARRRRRRTVRSVLGAQQGPDGGGVLRLGTPAGKAAPATAAALRGVRVREVRKRAQRGTGQGHQALQQELADRWHGPEHGVAQQQAACIQQWMDTQPQREPKMTTLNPTPTTCDPHIAHTIYCSVNPDRALHSYHPTWTGVGSAAEAPSDGLHVKEKTHSMRCQSCQPLAISRLPEHPQHRHTCVPGFRARLRLLRGLGRLAPAHQLILLQPEPQVGHEGQRCVILVLAPPWQTLQLRGCAGPARVCVYVGRAAAAAARRRTAAGGPATAPGAAGAGAHHGTPTRGWAAGWSPAGWHVYVGSASITGEWEHKYMALCVCVHAPLPLPLQQVQEQPEAHIACLWRGRKMDK
eukprot:1156368-Pelagomonas_calceolata.AAC.2